MHDHERDRADAHRDDDEADGAALLDRLEPGDARLKNSALALLLLPGLAPRLAAQDAPALDGDRRAAIEKLR